LNTNITPDPTQVKDTQEGEASDFYALLRRDLLSRKDVSDRAIRVFGLLDSHLIDKPLHIKRETLLKSYPHSRASLDRGLKELSDLGLLIVVRHRGSNYYTLPNPRKKSSVLSSSKSSDMSSLNSNNLKEIKSKSTQTVSEPLEHADKRLAAAASGSFLSLSDQEQGYLRAFSDAFREGSESLYIDVKALSKTSIKALLKAKNDDLLSADDLASMCVNWLSYQIEKRNLTKAPSIIDPIGFLIKALPAIVDGEGKAIPKVLKTTYQNVEEALRLPEEWNEPLETFEMSEADKAELEKNLAKIRALGVGKK
jgi:hypothetical protein